MVWRYLFLALVKSSSLNYSLPELNLSKILEYLSWTIHGRFSDMIRIRIYDSGSLSCTITHLRGVLKTRNGEIYFHLGFKHAGIKGSRSRWIHSEKGYITSFNVPWSEWSHRKTNICFEMTTEFACCTLPQGKGKYKRNPLFRLFTKKLTLTRMNSNINVTKT